MAVSAPSSPDSACDESGDGAVLGGNINRTNLPGPNAGGLKQALAALGRDVYAFVVCRDTGERFIVRYGQVLNRALHAVTQEYAWMLLPSGNASPPGACSSLLPR